jgi:hypothetical protein
MIQPVSTPPEGFKCDWLAFVENIEYIGIFGQISAVFRILWK